MFADGVMRKMTRGFAMSTGEVEILIGAVTAPVFTVVIPSEAG